MLTPDQENARTLARILGLSEEEAVAKLQWRVTVTPHGAVAEKFAAHFTRIAGLTIEIVDFGQPADFELAVNGRPRGGAAVSMSATIDGEGLSVEQEVRAVSDTSRLEPHDLAIKIAACYATGCVLAQRIGGDLLEKFPPPLRLEFRNLGLTPDMLNRVVRLQDAVLIGGGGVGNGFLWAAESLQLEGELTIVDPKPVSLGNLNRCTFFDDDDVQAGSNKAEVLARKARIPGLKLVPYVGRFGTLRSMRKRVKRVLVTVDSRAQRRSIQNELPLEVLDASTTGIEYVVVTSFAQPAKGGCLSCVYKHITQEDERERDIALGLGITVEQVKLDFIDELLARELADRHNLPDWTRLVGVQLSTLHKELCAARMLKTGEGAQGLAPFAFISNLAGALLVVELLRFEADRAAAQTGNYLQVSPWRAPHSRARQIRGKDPDCEFCSKPESLESIAYVWPEFV